jgi:hypothetical protein
MGAGGVTARSEEQRTMLTGLDTARAFLEPMPEPPGETPMPRRRFAFTLLFPCAVTIAGGFIFLAHECLDARSHPMPKPGPRRYPPGYHRTAH